MSTVEVCENSVLYTTAYSRLPSNDCFEEDACPPPFAFPDHFTPSAPMELEMNVMDDAQKANKNTKNLVFIAQNKTVICRDMSIVDADGKSKEVWRQVIAQPQIFTCNDIHVVHSAGMVVVKTLDKLIGMDAITGKVQWLRKMSLMDVTGLSSVVVDGLAVYIGFGSKVHAVSVLDGKLLWTQTIDEEGYLFSVVAIVPCGLSVFACTNRSMAFINASDGTLRWRVPCLSSLPSGPLSAAWDGENTVMIGGSGTIIPCDLSTGTLGKKLQLSLVNRYNIPMLFDSNKKVFYVNSGSSLCAISSGIIPKILWKRSVSKGFADLCVFPALALEPNRGNIYVAHRNVLVCIDTNGNKVFSKTLPIPFFERGLVTLVQDIEGSGRLYIGCNGHWLMTDAEGNVLESDDLKGLGFHHVFFCSESASHDLNASGFLCHAFDYRRYMRGLL